MAGDHAVRVHLDQRLEDETPQVHARHIDLTRRFADHPAVGLAYGHQRRVEMMRAVATNPKLLPLDEPSLGLSSLITDQVYDALRSPNDAGLTILLVEQNAHRALQATKRA